MRALLAIAALLYSMDVVPKQEWSGWQPWMFGAPCYTKTDIIEGTCKLEVRKPKMWKKRSTARQKGKT